MRLDYASPRRLSKPLRRTLLGAMLLLIALIALFTSTFLPIWSSTDFRGTIPTTYWNSDYRTTRN